jgi:hypothetical protein
MLDMGIIKVEFNFPELRETLTSIENRRKQFYDLLTREGAIAASRARSLDGKFLIYFLSQRMSDSCRVSKISFL